MSIRLSQPSGGRLEGVDVLRGLSVLLVTLHHIHLRFVLNDYPVERVLPGLLNRVVFMSGYYAVIIFFVISGFLITRLSIARWGELGQVHVGRFYAMRAARILPCLFVLLVVLSALDLAGAAEFMIQPERASLGQALWAALTFRVNWLEGHHGYLPGCWDILWSLSVEETFYLAFPLVCVGLRREWGLLLALGCLLVLGPVNRAWYIDQDPWGHYAYLSCMDGIAFGCLAALACARVQVSARVLRAFLVGGAAIAVVVIVGCDEDSAEGIARLGVNVTLLEAGVAAMLVALGSGVGNQALSRGTGWLRLLGRASYEIYLVHMLIVLGLIGVFKQMRPADSMIPWWYAGMLLLSLGVGYGVFRGFSEPVNRWLRGGRTGRGR
jgi:peptidoglycan/LPS O-acetylase OafA/YrhL